MNEDAEQPVVERQEPPSKSTRSIAADHGKRSPKSGKKKASTKAAKGSGTRKGHQKQKRPFPTLSLEDSLIIAQKIKEFNGGNPWPPAEIGNCIGKSWKAAPFFYLAAASRDYGLTEGTRDTTKISLGELGRSFVYAGNQQEEHASLQAAFFNVQLFKQVYSHYNGGTLPELKYLGNTLENEFKLDPSYHKEFHRIFQANCHFIQKHGSPQDKSANTSANNSNSNSVGTVIILAKPEKGSDLKIFVALPFSEKSGKWPTGFFNEVLNNLITPAGVQAGFSVETAKKEGSDIIQATIVNDLLNADLVVADLTDHNPNVLFELGMRMAFDKPVALLRAQGTSQIFDVDSMLRVLEYNPNLWKSTLENDIPRLESHIKGAWEGRKTSKSYLQLLKEQ